MQTSLHLMNTPISTSYRDYPTVNVSLLDDSEAEPETLPTESKTLTQEVLLDTLWALHGDCYLWSRDQRVPDAVATFLRRYTPVIKQLNDTRPNVKAFKEICVLAVGEFGKVRLMYGPGQSSPLAVKTLSKQYLLRRGEQACYMEERHALVANRNNPWVPRLEMALQDEEFLHLVMEYTPGGDLFGVLSRQDAAVLSENDARFYIAEVIVALDMLHKSGFVHRDVKPGNILIGADGHIKLADFGSSARMNGRGLVLSRIAVGTPDYVSPEVLRAQESKGISAAYGRECDWWAVGILLYECLYGDPPFAGDTLLETYHRVMHHQKYLVFPDDAQQDISEAARDLIRRLLCDRDQRLGLNGVEEIQQHPFFEGIQWDRLSEMTPPFIPELDGPEDVKYFTDVQEDSDAPIPDPTLPIMSLSPRLRATEFQGTHLPFIGYTFIPSLSSDADTVLSDTPNSTSHPNHALEPVNADADTLKLVQQELEQCQTTLEETRRELEASQTMLKSVKEELDASRQALEETTSALSEKEQMLETMQHKHLADQQALEAMQNELTACHQTVEEMNARVATLMEQKQAADTTIAQLRDELANVQQADTEMLAQLKAQVLAFNGERVRLERANNNIRATYQYKQKKFSEQVQEVSQELREILDMARTISQKSANTEAETMRRVSDLQRDRLRLTSELQWAMSERDMAVRAAAQSAAKQIVLENENATLIDALTAAREQIQTIMQDRDAALAQVEALQQENKEQAEALALRSKKPASEPKAPAVDTLQLYNVLNENLSHLRAAYDAAAQDRTRLEDRILWLENAVRTHLAAGNIEDTTRFYQTLRSCRQMPRTGRSKATPTKEDTQNLDETMLALINSSVSTITPTTEAVSSSLPNAIHSTANRPRPRATQRRPNSGIRLTWVRDDFDLPPLGTVSKQGDPVTSVAAAGNAAAARARRAWVRGKSPAIAKIVSTEQGEVVAYPVVAPDFSHVTSNDASKAIAALALASEQRHIVGEVPQLGRTNSAQPALDTIAAEPMQRVHSDTTDNEAYGPAWGCRIS